MSSRLLLCAVGLLWTALPAADGAWRYGEDGLELETADGGFSLGVRNRAQVRFTFDEPSGADSKGSFDIARYKLGIEGVAFRHWSYGLQADLAGGSEASGALLEDAWFRYGKRPLAQLWVGQGKVPFGRQALTSSGKLQFVDRSIASERFAHGRDVGIALLGHNENRTYAYQLGVYNGNGINKDEGDNIDYMAVARLAFTPYGEYVLDETDLDRPQQSRLAIAVAVLTNTTGTEGFEEERVSRGALELAYKKHGFGAVAEFFTESADIVLGAPQEEEDTDGWYVQVGYLFAGKHRNGRNPGDDKTAGGFEIAGRYSEIVFDVPMRDETEVGLAFGYHFTSRPAGSGEFPPVLRGNKIQVDLRRLEFEDESGAEEFLDRDQIRVQLQIRF